MISFQTRGDYLGAALWVKFMLIQVITSFLFTSGSNFMSTRLRDGCTFQNCIVSFFLLSTQNVAEHSILSQHTEKKLTVLYCDIMKNFKYLNDFFRVENLLMFIYNWKSMMD